MLSISTIQRARTSQEQCIQLIPTKSLVIVEEATAVVGNAGEVWRAAATLLLKDP